MSLACAILNFVTEISDKDYRAESRRLNRVRIASDILSALLVVAVITMLVLALVGPVLSDLAVILFGIWAFIVSLFALPALFVLHIAPPRVPLRERSALLASVSWFGRAAWAGVVFALAIVMGALAGVVASETSNASADAAKGLELSLQILGPMVLWPTIVMVAAVAYIVMAIRWLFDLGAIISEDGGRAVRALLEERWRGQFSRALKWATLFGLILEFGVGFISRAALALTLVTVAIAMGLLIGISSS